MTRTVVLEDAAGTEHRAEIRPDGTVTIAGRTTSVRPMPDGSLRIGANGGAHAWVAAEGDRTWVFLDGDTYVLTSPAPAGGHRGGRTRRRGSAHHGSLSAPMPAAVRRVQVAAGDAVRRGDVLIVLEAMKMELPIRATADGRVTAINCREGEMVQAGQDLLEVDEE